MISKMIHITLCTLFLGTLAAAAEIGAVAAMQGSAELERENQRIPVANAMDVMEQDRVITQERSRVQVLLHDKMVVTIGPLSLYTFESYDAEKDPHVTMRAERGFFKTLTGRISKVAPERFTIKTKSASIGIRGTYFVGYVGDDIERIGCIDGAIVVTTLDGKRYEVPAGKMLVFEQGVWQLYPLDLKLFAPVMPGLDEFTYRSPDIAETPEEKALRRWVGHGFMFEQGVPQEMQDIVIQEREEEQFVEEPFAIEPLIEQPAVEPPPFNPGT